MSQTPAISTTPIKISHSYLTHYIKSFGSWFDFIWSFNLTSRPRLKVNNKRSGGLESVFKSKSSNVRLSNLPFNPPAPLVLSLHALISFSAHSSPIVHLSSLGFHLWRMGEACSWHTNTPPTVYIHFRQNPVHSLKVRSINTVWCWNTTLRLLAGCLRGDLLLWGYCFHPSYYLWFGRNLHICFIPLYNIERYHVADKNNTKWLQCMLLHWYSSNCCQILRAKSNWIVITAVARPHKNDEEQSNGRASEQNFLTLLNYFAETQSWHARGNAS